MGLRDNRIIADAAGKSNHIQQLCDEGWQNVPGRAIMKNHNKGVRLMYIANEKRYDSLPYNRSGKSGLQLGAVSLGLWHNFGEKY